MINAILAVELSAANRGRQVRDADAKLLTKRQRRVKPFLREAQGENSRPMWWKRRVAGGKTYEIVDLLIPIERLQDLLDEEADITVLAVLQPDGSDYDAAKWPRRKTMLSNLAAEAPVYDVDGNQTGTRKLAWNEHPGWLGWKR